jgi:hypothetical protein
MKTAPRDMKLPAQRLMREFGTAGAGLGENFFPIRTHVSSAAQSLEQNRLI